MGEFVEAALRRVLTESASKIHSCRGRGLGEQNTKASLIDPIIEALGWDTRNWEEVHREFKAKPRDKPVDYALKIMRKPRLLIEAKALGEDLSDRRWITQILGYATVVGVEWCILTDGDEYRFYNASAPVDADEKVFGSFKVSAGDADQAIKYLTPIARSNLEENLLESLWNAHFVDRRVRGTIQSLLDSADGEFVRLVCKKTPKLTPAAVADSLARLDILVRPGSDVPKRTGHGRRATAKPETRRPRNDAAPEKKREHVGVSVADLITAGFLKPPTTLFNFYFGKRYEATLLPDGQLEFREKTYSSPSLAGEAARKAATGKRHSTNGWEFWQLLDESRKETSLAAVRSKYLENLNRGK